jgi:hypothetical protein
LLSSPPRHSGWIDLDVKETQDCDDIREHALERYRCFALKRILKML